MDHQVKNDTDISPAGLVGSNPDCINEARPDNFTFHRQKRRVEPLKMPDLKDQTVTFRNRYQVFGLFYRSGNRFFEKDMDTIVQKERGCFIMHSGRDNNTYQIDPAGKFQEIRKGLCTDSCSDLCRTNRI